MTKILKIEGMTCMHCAMTVTKTLESLAGIKKASVDLKNKTATAEISNDKITDEILRLAVEDAGYEIIDIQ